MRTSDGRSAHRATANQTRHAACGRAAPKALWTDPAADSSGWSRAEVALLAATLASGLALAGCAASGIDHADGACAAHRASITAHASCLRSNHAVLTSGSSMGRDLSSRYLAEANHLDEQVRAGKMSNGEAVAELARSRRDLAARAQERNDAAWRNGEAALNLAAGIIQPQGQQAQGQGDQIRDSQIVRSPQSDLPGFGPPPGLPGFGPPPGLPGFGPPVFQPAWR